MLHRQASRFVGSLTLLASGAIIPGCSKTENQSEAARGGGVDHAKLLVYVVNYPLRYFAERIGGDAVRVEFPAPADVDPVYWTPDAEIVAAYQKADLILLNGADYAKWVARVSLPTSKLVDTSKAVKDKYIEAEDAVTHAHGPEGKHAHGGMAFMTWLDLTLAVEQSRAIRDALVSLAPKRTHLFRDGFEALERDLRDLDQRIGKIVSARPDQPLVFSHPVYQYLARRYGLHAKSVHWEPDEMPDDKMWEEFEALLTSHPAKWMIWEDMPRSRVAEKLTGLGVASTVFAPCSNAPAEGDWLRVMEQNIQNLERVFRE